jgi:hypothetical protein
VGQQSQEEGCSSSFFIPLPNKVKSVAQSLRLAGEAISLLSPATQGLQVQGPPHQVSCGEHNGVGLRVFIIKSLIAATGDWYYNISLA